MPICGSCNSRYVSRSCCQSAHGGEPLTHSRHTPLAIRRALDWSGNYAASLKPGTAAATRTPTTDMARPSRRAQADGDTRPSPSRYHARLRTPLVFCSQATPPTATGKSLDKSLAESTGRAGAAVDELRSRIMHAYMHACWGIFVLIQQCIFRFSRASKPALWGSSKTIYTNHLLGAGVR